MITLLKLMIVVPLSAALVGCATVPETVAPKIEKVYIPVPAAPTVRVMPAVPAWKVDALPIGASIDEQVKALVGEREQRKAYEIELFGACK